MSTETPELVGTARQQVKQLLALGLGEAATVKGIAKIPDVIARGKFYVSVFTAKLDNFQDLLMGVEITVNVMVNANTDAEVTEDTLEDARDAALIVLQRDAPFLQIESATRVVFEDTYPGYEVKITARMHNPYRP